MGQRAAASRCFQPALQDFSSLPGSSCREGSIPTVFRRYPELADVVSIKHIASFLCMSPVSLSRLRGQLRKRGEEPPVKQSRLSEKSGLF